MTSETAERCMLKTLLYLQTMYKLLFFYQQHSPSLEGQEEEIPTDLQTSVRVFYVILHMYF